MGPQVDHTAFWVATTCHTQQKQKIPSDREHFCFHIFWTRWGAPFHTYTILMVIKTTVVMSLVDRDVIHSSSSDAIFASGAPIVVRVVWRKPATGS